MLTNLQIAILKKLSPGAPTSCSGQAYQGKSKLAMLMGEDIFQKTAGKVVIDFGCGEGSEAIEIAQKGAKKVIGLDIQEDGLVRARQKAQAAGLTNTHFASTTDEPADIVISVDAFEHFGDPGEILRIMSTLMHAKGEVMVSFGPIWYHPLGGHLFSVFPWAHLIFSEKALIGWRSTFKTDGATRFSEVVGGLNQMTIAKFERLVAQSPLQFAHLELVPIKQLSPLHNRLTREFTTAVVRCRLTKRP